MMYNDIDNDLPPFNDPIDEIFLFSGHKSSSTGDSFLHDDDDEHLRHHQHSVAGSSSHHLPVDVDELLLNGSFLEQQNCDQLRSTPDPLFWNCKGISDDQLNEFMPQSQLNLNGNINHDGNGSNLVFGQQQHLSTVNQATNTTNNSIASASNIDQHLHQTNQLQQHHHQVQVTHHQHHALVTTQHTTNPSIHSSQRHMQTSQQQHHHHHEPYQITIISGVDGTTQQQHLISNGGPLLNGASVLPQAPAQYCQGAQTVVVTTSNGQHIATPATLDQNHILVASGATGIVGGLSVTSSMGSMIIDQYGNHHAIQHTTPNPALAINGNSNCGITAHQQLHTQQQPQQQSQQEQSALVKQEQQQKQEQQMILGHSAPQLPINQSSQVQQAQASVAPEKSVSSKIGQSVPDKNETSNTKKEAQPKTSKPKEKQTRLDCPYCKRSFSKNFDLQQHMRCHTGEKPFQCIVCGRGFAQKSNVKKHMQAHKVWPEGPSISPMPSSNPSARSRNNSASSSVGTPHDDECMQENEINDNNNTNGTPGLSNDKKNEGGDIFAENRYSCSYCNFNGRTYFELKSHLTIHKREKVFKCIVSSCGKTFSGSDLQGFLDHVTGHKDLIYHCHLCSGQFYSLDEFGEHQKHHSNAQMKRTTQTQSLPPNQQLVNVLNRQNSNTSLRQQNQQVAPTQLQQQQNQKQYNQQPTTQNNSQQLNNEKNPKVVSAARSKNSNQKFFRCSKCMNRYTTQTALDHHLSISTHNFPCTECNKVFMCERYLRRHLNTHTAVQHICTYCDKHFKTAAYLKMHSVVHTGEKPFRCNQCEAAFNRRDKLNRHKLTHETIKKFKCPFKPHIGCTKEFNRPDKLKAHVLTHSGIRPHPCDACDRTFSRLSRLREHKKLHHDTNNNNIIMNSTSASPKEVDPKQKQENEPLLVTSSSTNGVCGLKSEPDSPMCA